MLYLFNIESHFLPSFFKLFFLLQNASLKAGLRICYNIKNTHIYWIIDRRRLKSSQQSVIVVNIMWVSFMCNHVIPGRVGQGNQDERGRVMEESLLAFQ
jgi:hypothetical protein